MRSMSDALRDRIEQYYATVPLLFSDAEEFGSLRLFVRREPGAPYYGGPGHAQPVAGGAAADTAYDIARVRARQRELGVPEAFEWLAEAAPALRTDIEAAGLTVAERPLMALPPHRPVDPQPLPEGVTLRVLTADDPALPATLALPRLAFGHQGTESGPAGREELTAVAAELTQDGTVATTRPTVRAGHKTLIAALAPDSSRLDAAAQVPSPRGRHLLSGELRKPSVNGLRRAARVRSASHRLSHNGGARRARGEPPGSVEISEGRRCRRSTQRRCR
ncbi:GNAT family N-acetyltransferase [Streptomyces sp. 900105755]